MTNKTKKTKLTPKQSMFCKEYLIDLNATQAAIRAGYSEKTARQIAADNLSKVVIQEEIRRLVQIRANNTELSAEYVLTNLKKVAERCLQAEPILIKDGDDYIESGEWKFDSSGANKSLELLGKHLKLFTDKIEHEVPEGVSVNVSFGGDSAKDKRRDDDNSDNSD